MCCRLVQFSCFRRRCDELGHGGSSPPVYIRHSATLKSSLLPFNVRLLSHLCSLFFWVLTSLSSHCGLELSALDYFHNVCGSWDWWVVCLLQFDGIDCPWFCVLVLHSLYVARGLLSLGHCSISFRCWVRHCPYLVPALARHVVSTGFR